MKENIINDIALEASEKINKFYLEFTDIIKNTYNKGYEDGFEEGFKLGLSVASSRKDTYIESPFEIGDTPRNPWNKSTPTITTPYTIPYNTSKDYYENLQNMILKDRLAPTLSFDNSDYAENNAYSENQYEFPSEILDDIFGRISNGR